MVRKTKTGLPRRSTAKPGKKKKPAAAKTSAEIVQANNEQLAIDNRQSAIETPPGIICPRCGCRDLRAMDGRPWEITHTLRRYGFISRRRVCRHCGKTVVTRERLEEKDS